PAFAIDVTKTGNGLGSVASTPAGIDCGSTCSASFASGAVVTLTPTAAAGSSFGGWGGDCSGTGTCAVTADAAKGVTATFVATTSVTATFSMGPFIVRGLLVRVVRRHGRTSIAVTLRADRRLTGRLRLLRRGRTIASRKLVVRRGRHTVRLGVPAHARAGSYRLELRLRDASGYRRGLVRTSRVS